MSIPPKKKKKCEGPVKLDFDHFPEDAYSVQGHFESDDDLDFEDPHYNMVSLRSSRIHRLLQRLHSPLHS